jgi:hypothetical protein
VIDVGLLDHQFHGYDNRVACNGRSGDGVRSPDHTWFEFGDLLTKEIEACPCGETHNAESMG